MALGGLAAFGLTATGAIAEAEPVTADEGHTYTVVNTDGDGVWLHSDPGLGDANDLIITMPEGTAFDADCFVYDTPVGERGNTAWLHGTDDKGNTGYFTDYYSSSQWNLDNTLEDQGLPYCGQENVPEAAQATEPQQQRGGVVYYRPDISHIKTAEGEQGPSGALMMTNEGDPDWTAGSCNNEHANDFPTEVGGRLVTTLAGWSLGRLGPIYFLEQEHDTRRHNIDYITLFDPGNRDEYFDKCGNRTPSQSTTLAKWLLMDSDNRLVIFAGEVTEQNGHEGIQDGLFPEIRDNQEINDQVVVCSYHGMNHEVVYTNYREMVNQPKIIDTKDCPSDTRNGSKIEGWRP